MHICHECHNCNFIQCANQAHLIKALGSHDHVLSAYTSNGLRGQEIGENVRNKYMHACILRDVKQDTRKGGTCKRKPCQ
jgi:hypothetical protein